MPGNSFGTLFRITTFGESHGEAVLAGKLAKVDDLILIHSGQDHHVDLDL